MQVRNESLHVRLVLFGQADGFHSALNFYHDTAVVLLFRAVLSLSHSSVLVCGLSLRRRGLLSKLGLLQLLLPLCPQLHLQNVLLFLEL